MLRFARLIKISKIAATPLRFSSSLSASSYLNGTSANYLESMYSQWKQDPATVPADYNSLFQAIQAEEMELPEFSIPSNSTGFASSPELMKKVIGVHRLIEMYRQRGNEKSKIYPLDISPEDLQTGLRFSPDIHQVLDYKNYGLTESDLNSTFHIQDEGVFAQGVNLKLSEIIAKMEALYCGPMSLETSHILNDSERLWLLDYYETHSIDTSNEHKKKIFDHLFNNHLFAEALNFKVMPHKKRFTVEGLDSMISGLQHLAEKSCEEGFEHMILGMAHRGRLNVLSSLLNKPIKNFAIEAKELKYDLKYTDIDEWGHTGDVKYHMGHEHTITSGANRLKIVQFHS